MRVIIMACLSLFNTSLIAVIVTQNVTQKCDFRHGKEGAERSRC